MTKQNEVPVWVVSVVCFTVFKWWSSFSDSKQTQLRVVAASTEEVARSKAVEMVKRYWEERYSGLGLKRIEVDNSYAVDISEGNDTELS